VFSDRSRRRWRATRLAAFGGMQVPSTPAAEYLGAPAISGPDPSVAEGRR